MIDPSIEEIREAIEEEVRLWSLNNDRISSDSTAKFVLDSVKRIQLAAAPRPSTPRQIWHQTFGDQVFGKVEHIDLIEEDGSSTRLPSDALFEYYRRRLSNEGYEIHYDGKPVQPKSSPVVDTGEDPKVELAKQINTLARLLDAEGYKYGQLCEAIEVLRPGSRPEIRSFWGGHEDLNVKNLASYMSQIQASELKPLTLDAVMSVLRDQFILSTDITQAIDRLNELVAITSEGEKE